MHSVYWGSLCVSLFGLIARSVEARLTVILDHLVNDILPTTEGVQQSISRTAAQVREELPRIAVHEHAAHVRLEVYGSGLHPRQWPDGADHPARAGQRQGFLRRKARPQKVCVPCVRVVCAQASG